MSSALQSRFFLTATASRLHSNPSSAQGTPKSRAIRDGEPWGRGLFLRWRNEVWDHFR